MNNKLYIVGGIIGVMFLIALIIPIGLLVGVGEPIKIKTPTEALFSDGSNAFQTEVTCSYFVRGWIQDLPIIRYSSSEAPEAPSCEFLTLYWHDGWLIDPGTVLF